MNALYLTYATLALIYFLLGKKWDTKWLQQGNYLFLALVATVMLSRPIVEYGVAYYSGYLTEQLAYYGTVLRIGQVSIWVGVILLPMLGLFNYAKRFRERERFQFITWCLVLSTVLLSGSFCSFEAHMFGYPVELYFLPGWHTVLPVLSITELCTTLLVGAVISTLLGWMLKRLKGRNNEATI
ncbi:MAG: hypothetical protein AB8F78_09455 [Saprospiraceae bacterium]